MSCQADVAVDDAAPSVSILLMEAGDAIVLLHYLVFTCVCIAFFILSKREYFRAKESWLRATERVKSDDDKHSWSQQQLGSNDLELEIDDEVVHADLGKFSLVPP